MSMAVLVTDDGEASAGSRPITAIMHTDTGRVHSQLEAEAFGIAMRYKITIYDALYIAPRRRGPACSREMGAGRANRAFGT